MVFDLLFILVSQGLYVPDSLRGAARTCSKYTVNAWNFHFSCKIVPEVPKNQTSSCWVFINQILLDNQSSHDRNAWFGIKYELTAMKTLLIQLIASFITRYLSVRKFFFQFTEENVSYNKLALINVKSKVSVSQRTGFIRRKYHWNFAMTLFSKFLTANKTQLIRSLFITRQMTAKWNKFHLIMKNVTQNFRIHSICFLSSR